MEWRQVRGEPRTPGWWGGEGGVKGEGRVGVEREGVEGGRERKGKENGDGGCGRWGGMRGEREGVESVEGGEGW